MSDDSAYWRTPFHRPRTTPHFVPEPDKRVKKIHGANVGTEELLCSMLNAQTTCGNHQDVACSA